MLNLIWALLMVVSVLAAVIQLAMGRTEAVNELMGAFFSSAENAVKIAIGLAGLLCAWLGICRIMEESGIMSRIAGLLTPLFRVIMPEIPPGHPALGSVTMNLSANMLGLDNAATPLGIRAMKDLQSLNSTPDTATNAQIMFLVLNTSSVCLFPVTVFLYRAQMGAAAPADVFVPMLLATTASTVAGFLVTALVQRIPLLRLPVLLWGVVLLSLAGGVAAWGMWAGAALSEQSSLVANLVLLLLVGGILLWALIRGVKPFEVFIQGAREGFATALEILPFLVAMLVAVGMFRASGALDMILDGVRWAVSLVAGDVRFVDALPVAAVKPLSGSGARAMMIDVMETFGADSFQGRLASVMQGSTETTFYVMAVYFGSVGISRVRHAVACGLTADAVAAAASVFFAWCFFG